MNQLLLLSFLENKTNFFSEGTDIKSFVHPEDENKTNKRLKKTQLSFFEANARQINIIVKLTYKKMQNGTSLTALRKFCIFSESFCTRSSVFVPSFDRVEKRIIF